MSDSSALSAAVMIGQQLEIYRWSDHWKQMQSTGMLAADHAALRQRFSELVAQYNQLVSNHDELRRQAEKVSRGSDRKADTIAELTTKVRSLEATAATRAWETEKDKADIAYLELALADTRNRYNQLVPGAYPIV